jgi:predicted PurR-regulated permease PerM
VSQFVPTIGTYIAGALPVVVALADDPAQAVWVLGFVVVYQQIENYVFAPRITARTMQLHPAVAFGTVIAGAALFGAVGALLALPAAAVIQALGSTYIARHEVIDSKMTTEPARKAARTRFTGRQARD